jgi:hypothetical protein
MTVQRDITIGITAKVSAPTDVAVTLAAMAPQRDAGSPWVSADEVRGRLQRLGFEGLTAQRLASRLRRMERMPMPPIESREGSPARAPARSAFATGSTTPRPFCGARWPEPLASFDPATSSWRTWRTSLLSTMEPSGEKFSGTWPRSGTTSSGIAYRQQPSAPRTSVTGSSPLLPTPTAAPYGNNQSPSEGAAVRPSLEGLVRLLPTPRSSPQENRQTKRTPSQEAGKHGLSLAAEVVALLPTPVAGDGKGTRQSTAKNPRSPYPTMSDLAFEWSGAATAPQSGGGNKQSSEWRLNPSFVEWMLGAPQGWSDPECPLSATEFSARSEPSPAPTSSTSNDSELVPKRRPPDGV